MEKSRYNKITSQFHKRTVLVIGDLMLDKYLWGHTDRISPEAPVPIVEVNNIDFRPGGAANVALNLSSLGCNVIIIGVIGSDSDGENLLNLLKKYKVDCSNIVISDDRYTTVKTRIMSQDQQVLRADYEVKTPLSDNLLNKIYESLKSVIDNVDALILQDYNKGVFNITNIPEIISLANNSSKPIYVDPKNSNFKSFKNVRLFKPNLIEFFEGFDSNQSSIKNDGFQLKEELNADMVFITQGSDGASLFESSEYHHIPTKARKVHDVSGAGDTVISIFALSDLCDANPKEAAVLSNYAAGRVCEEVGVVPITLNMLNEIVENYRD